MSFGMQRKGSKIINNHQACERKNARTAFFLG